MAPGEEIKALRAQAQAIAGRLQAIRARIGEIADRGSRAARVAFVDPVRCVGCGACEEVCPAAAIQVQDIAVIDGAKCTGCGRCAAQCPQRAIALRES